MSRYFGTDGFRGQANVALTADHAYAIGRFLGWYYGQEHKARVVIGKDTRRSSYMFESALCAGLTASGADAYLLHVTTTPSVAYVARTENFDCGIMISASHNAYYDNGIKLLNGRGEKMDDAVTALVEDHLDGKNGALPYAVGDQIGRVIDYAAGRNRYMGFLLSLAAHSYQGKKIGLDCANGSTWQLAKHVFDALGADTYVIANTPDGVNINENCGSTHMKALQQLVLEQKLDAGFAFDGDADRCLAVDEHGCVVNGDQIMYLCARSMQKQGVLGDSRVVTTVMSNIGLYKALDALGIGYEKTRVGDRFVWECMRAGGHLLGGEQSGHIIFARHATTGDGLMTALNIMEAMCSSKQTLSQLTAPVTIYPQVLKNVVVTDKDEAVQHPDVLAAVARCEARLGDSGRVLLRKSGTEPLVRVMAEAETDGACHEAVDEIIGAMQAAGILIRVK